ncbi:hypothetical protein Leryth_017410 [Lithospermum erythrorhizon]|nr:hypothetical protein Leryth_017410 [Lithospermum erythrorhizon]
MSEMNEISKNPTCKRIKQSISIPFMWEEKPGIPKKDWKPPSIQQKTDHIVAQVVPVKFIASIPFQWEEKPGIPLPCFSPATPQRVDIICPLSPPKCSEDDDDSSRVDGCGGRGDTENCNEISESELDIYEYYSDDSFSSAPSIIENGGISTFEISNVAPLQSTLSPASQAESSTSSYATGSASIGGNSFLEWLFPLLTPSGDAKFNRKVATQEKINTSNCSKKHTEEPNHETKDIAIISSPLTLGELIMMSRRRSYQRKAMRRMKSNHSMELMKTREFGCSMLGAKNGMRLLQQKWKNQFQLKLL